MQAEPGSKIQLGRVLAHKAGGKFSVGQPYVEGVKVEAEVLEELKGPKVRQHAGVRAPCTALLGRSLQAHKACLTSEAHGADAFFCRLQSAVC